MRIRRPEMDFGPPAHIIQTFHNGTNSFKTIFSPRQIHGTCTQSAENTPFVCIAVGIPVVQLTLWSYILSLCSNEGDWNDGRRGCPLWRLPNSLTLGLDSCFHNPAPSYSSSIFLMWSKKEFGKVWTHHYKDFPAKPLWQSFLRCRPLLAYTDGFLEICLKSNSHHGVSCSICLSGQSFRPVLVCRGASPLLASLNCGYVEQSLALVFGKI